MCERMTQALPPHPASQRAPIPLGEFVAMVAALMALGALGVDAMLPALPEIGAQLGAPSENAQQYVIAIYLIGMGVGQLIHGPLSDHFGRRPVMLASLGNYFCSNYTRALSASFTLLLVARFASPTVLVLRWFGARLPETLVRAEKRPYSFAATLEGARQTRGDRWSTGYMLASTVMQGALFGYITSVQQVVAEVFHRPKLLNVVFASTAGLMAVSNLINSRVVMRVGSRNLTQSALVVLIGVALAALLLSQSGIES